MPRATRSLFQKVTFVRFTHDTEGSSSFRKFIQRKLLLQINIRHVDCPILLSHCVKACRPETGDRVTACSSCRSPPLLQLPGHASIIHCARRLRRRPAVLSCAPVWRTASPQPLRQRQRQRSRRRWSGCRPGGETHRIVACDCWERPPYFIGSPTDVTTDRAARGGGCSGSGDGGRLGRPADADDADDDDDDDSRRVVTVARASCRSTRATAITEAAEGGAFRSSESTGVQPAEAASCSCQPHEQQQQLAG